MSTGRPRHYGHLLQVPKESLTLYTSFHDLIHVHSCMSGADNPRGQNFDVKETSCHFGHLQQFSKASLWVWHYTIFFTILYMDIAPGQGLMTAWGQNFDVNSIILSLGSFVGSFKKIPLKSDFIQFFHDFIHIFSPGAATDSPQWTKFWCQQKCLVTSFICCMFQKNVFEVWFYTFFPWFITCIQPWGRGRQPPGDKILMSTARLYHFTHLLQVSKKSLWSLILYNFFHNFIYVYSPRAGADNPLGTQFWCQQEHLVILVICCKFQKNLFEVWFYTICFMTLYMYIAPGQGQTTPRGQCFDFNRNVRSLHSFVANFKKKVFGVWFYTIFSWFILIHLYSPGQGQTATREQNFDVNRKALSLYPFVACFKEISLKSDFIHFFHNLIHVYSPKARGIQPPRDKILMPTETSCQFSYLLLVSKYR